MSEAGKPELALDTVRAATVGWLAGSKVLEY